jgi:hypothetical protein
MQIIPLNKQGWLRALVFPFKAYVIIAPVLLLISVQFPHPRHSGATDAEAFCVVSLGPCCLVLLLAGMLFSIFGPKGHAASCFGFAFATVILIFMLLPELATA